LAKAAVQLEGHEDCLWSSDDPSSGFVQTITGCRHQEFVPLLLRGVDLLPFHDPKRELVATVYESFPQPEEGFTALLGYLTRAHPAGAGDVFAYWVRHDEEHEASKRRQEELKKPIPNKAAPQDPKKAARENLLATYFREIEVQEEAAWRTSRRHLDTRLTSKQFVRLGAVSNVWVRALLYSHYPAQCPPAWVDALLQDLQWSVRPPEGFQRLLAELDNAHFVVRERASSELAAFGPAIAPKLRAVLRDGRLSPEAQMRIARVLKQVESTGLPRLIRRTIAHLTAEPAAQNRRMVDVLTGSDFPNLITEEARKAVAAHKREEEERHARDEERQRQEKEHAEQMREVLRQKAEYKHQANPPSEYVHATIRKVDPQDGAKVVIAAGSDHGLRVGHTLEVYRLKSRPLYLGMVRIEQVEEQSATAKRVGPQPTKQSLQEGDEVCDKLGPR
jgi:hypothetical protein